MSSHRDGSIASVGREGIALCAPALVIPGGGSVSLGLEAGAPRCVERSRHRAFVHG